MPIVFRDITQSVGDLQNGLVKTKTGIYTIVDFDVDGYINVYKRFVSKTLLIQDNNATGL